MLKRLEDAPAGIDGFTAVGKVTKEDYERVIEPVLDDARRTGRHVRVLLQVGPEYEGFTAGVAWEKTGTVLRSLSVLRLVDGYALVTDIGWLRESVRMMSFWLPFPLQVFGNDERDKAVAWLESLPEGAGVTHRLVAESGIIVVEISQPLRTADFDALALTADAWLDTHQELRGVVLHAREFPGWENVAGMLRHIRFVRDHHRRVRRVALAADSKLASLAPRLAEHFVQAEVKGFGYDELDDAIAWAADRQPAPAAAGAATG